MIIDHENPADISYVSVYSDPNRQNEVMDEEESALRRYCNILEWAVIACEVITLASIAICAFLI